MKLWLTTTENKCFAKMLWHLLGKYVKVTVLLVCSICTVHRAFFFFFFKSSICALFSIYKRMNRLINNVMNNIFGLVTCLFPPFFFQVHQLGLSFFFWIFFLRIFIYLLCTCNISLHCIHIKSSNYYIHLISSIVHIWFIESLSLFIYFFKVLNSCYSVTLVCQVVL